MVRVVTAEEMRAVVMQRLREATIVVMAAAVSDFRVRSVAAQKMKREAARAVLAELGKDGRYSARGGGEAGGGDDGGGVYGGDGRMCWRVNGRLKLARKGVDAVVVSDVSVDGIGFDSEENAGTS